MARGANTTVEGSTRAAEDRFNLGLRLEEGGDLTTAERAYRQADALGHAAAAVNLGILIEQRGDLEDAESCYERAGERGDANGTFNYGGLLLLAGLLAMSLADFVSLGLPALKEMSPAESSNALRLGGELGAALAIAAAGIAGLKSPRESRRELVGFELGAGAGVVVLGLLLAILIGARTLHPGTGGAADDPAALSVHTISAAILFAAAIAFVARSPRADSPTVLFAAACLLLAAANLRYLAAPAVRIDWVTPKDGLRLAAYGLLLAGASLRHANLQRNAASAAIASERERIARDRHDGLAQDLACIAVQGQRLDCQLGPEHPLMVATRHALAASRGVIADLTASAAPTTKRHFGWSRTSSSIATTCRCTYGSKPTPLSARRTSSSRPGASISSASLARRSSMRQCTAQLGTLMSSCCAGPGRYSCAYPMTGGGSVTLSWPGLGYGACAPALPRSVVS